MIENLNEFKELIDKYKAITLEEISKKWNEDGWHTMERITGFGDSTMCVLCVAVDYSSNGCGRCVYNNVNDHDSCTNGLNSKTYNDIHYAESPTLLLKAIQKRIEHLEAILKTI